MNTDTNCHMIHLMVQRMETELNWYINALTEEGQGWSPRTLPMMHLDNAAKTLETLADKIQSIREHMTETEAA